MTLSGLSLPLEAFGLPAPKPLLSLQDDMEYHCKSGKYPKPTNLEYWYVTVKKTFHLHWAFLNILKLMVVAGYLDEGTRKGLWW